MEAAPVPAPDRDVLTIEDADLVRMREQLLFEGAEARRKLSRFWSLLVLAAVIASAGIVSDSTATVIGAMIVAPLMTPILGTVLSTVLGDVRNLVRSVGLVVSGAAAVVAVGYLVGWLVPYDVVASTSSQVAGRIHPRLIDLVAALATGAVGAFALVRSDVSDTLPGVAIAISLVPPLAVVGTTLQAGAGDEAAGALLLFLTNVGAILLSGLIVMELYRVRRTATHDADGRHGWVSISVTVAFLLVVCVPLAVNSTQIAQENLDVSHVDSVADRWASDHGWRVDQTQPESDAIVVRASGPPPAPSASELRAALDDAGLEKLDVRLVLTPEQTVELHGD